MSIPPVSVQRPPPAGVTKPFLPPGWSCHVSKSVPGKCYYFNRFTGAKTWELGELLPGHSDNPTPAVPVPGSAQLPIVVQDQHHLPSHHRPVPAHHPGDNEQPGQTRISLPGVGFNHQDLSHATSYSQKRPGHPLNQRVFQVTQGHHQPRWPKLTGPPLDPSPSATGLGDELASLGVAELEAMLEEKRRNLQEMAKKMSVDSSADSSSVESGFVSLMGREEEGLVGSEVSDRQKELTESGGLYSDWGKVGVTVEPSRPKRAKIEFDDNSVETNAVNVFEEGVDVTVEAVDNDNDNNNAVHADQSDVKNNNNNNSDSDSFDEDSLCGADPEELAAPAKLNKKFPTDHTVTPTKSEDLPSTTQSSTSPPELLLFDNDCQFSPEPSSNEEGDSEG